MSVIVKYICTYFIIRYGVSKIYCGLVNVNQLYQVVVYTVKYILFGNTLTSTFYVTCLRPQD